MKLISTKNLIGSLCGAAMLTAAMTSCAPKQNTLTEEEIATVIQAAHESAAKAKEVMKL